MIEEIIKEIVISISVYVVRKMYKVILHSFKDAPIMPPKKEYRRITLKNQFFSAFIIMLASFILRIISSTSFFRIFSSALFFFSSIVVWGCFEECQNYIEYLDKKFNAGKYDKIS